MDPDDRANFYKTLWGHSNLKPYDEQREAEVTQRRFGPAIPYIEARVQALKGLDQRLKVLDFGCADGFTAEQILTPVRDRIEYLASDLFSLDETSQRMRERGFTTEVSIGGVDQLPDHWREVDVVLALSCFQYIEDTAATFGELAGRLSRGGIFVGYFYDASPLRRISDDYLRDAVGTPGSGIEDLKPLARLLGSLRDATEGRDITVHEEVPELAVPKGTMPLQQFIIDYVLFAWAPGGAETVRIQWALAELLLTGSHTYLGPGELDRLLSWNGLNLLERVSGPSGHLVIAEKP